ncbi:LysM peptidoglycan-binding domain-containing protein [Xanthovirga aplysinae]|uniref:LysM peptidoglycan-binding domain-containing protein n=1 Tax=Xanthovirga aplysinae TaxID=2529853 RepID=UPI0012BCE7AC|nr:LysM peptidoglycan-binding domain-containing protein [Xanthovirga aplysinae]MTI31420.1 LysM peptidoglycan-binding domain-containing protein [Xanthovirga aplysinae]
MPNKLPQELEQIRRECSQDLHNGLLSIDMDIRSQLQYQAQGSFKPVIPFNQEVISTMIKEEIERVDQKMQRRLNRYVQDNGTKIHIVKHGDTLWKIKNQYGVSLNLLLRHNPHITKPDTIIPGQRIVIPAKVNLGPEPVVINLEIPEESLKHIHFVNTDAKNEGEVLSEVSRYIAIGGTTWGGYDELIHNHKTYKTTKGVVKNIYKTNGKVRSMRAAKFARASSAVKGVGYVFVVGGILIDSYGLLNYYNNPDPNAFKVHPAKFALNTMMTGVALWGGPVGWVISGTYFVVDATIGWDNAFKGLESVTEKNQAIHGPGWSPFRDGAIK